MDLPEADRDAAIERFNLLMAKARAGARREWMERRGADAQAADVDDQLPATS